MLATIIIVCSAFYWLLVETDYLRVNLNSASIDYRQTWLDTFTDYGIYYSAYGYTDIAPCDHDIEPHKPQGYSIREALKGVARVNGTYEIIVSPNSDVICGRDWLDAHWNDLKDYKPEVYLKLGGIRYNMTIRQPAIIKDVMKVNKLTRQQKLAYAE
jgi:hypothetical protein